MTRFNPYFLARTVVAWLEFEALCGREKLFRESYLTPAIGQHLKAQGHHVAPEFSHPTLNQGKGPGRRAAIDFVLTERHGKHIRHAIETKWMSGKGCVPPQEIYDDLIRLEAIPPDDGVLGRWLLLAGRSGDIAGRNWLAPYANFRGRRRLHFTNVLRVPSKTQVVVKVAEPLPWQEPRWKRTSGFVDELPCRFKTKLEAFHCAAAGDTDWSCYVWRISRIQNRRTFEPQ